MFTSPEGGDANLIQEQNGRRDTMPQIIVRANRGEGHIMLRERVNPADFESDHFAAMLVERIGWAVSDAEEAEQNADAADAEEVEAVRALATAHS
jgi:hypothetical protein